MSESDEEVALFTSEFNGLKVSLTDVDGLEQDQVDFSAAGGRYSTSDPDVIEALRDHEGYGRSFEEVTNDEEAGDGGIDYSEEELLQMVENDERDKLRRIAADFDSVNGNASNEDIAESLMELAKKDGEHEEEE